MQRDLGSLNSVHLSVIRVLCDKTKQGTADIFIPHKTAITPEILQKIPGLSRRCGNAANETDTQTYSATLLITVPFCVWHKSATCLVLGKSN